jgi:hypothetical protein
MLLQPEQSTLHRWRSLVYTNDIKKQKQVHNQFEYLSEYINSCISTDYLDMFLSDG